MAGHVLTVGVTVEQIMSSVVTDDAPEGIDAAANATRGAGRARYGRR
jgi:hypothetical protein